MGKKDPFLSTLNTVPKRAIYGWKLFKFGGPDGLRYLSG